MLVISDQIPPLYLINLFSKSALWSTFGKKDIKVKLIKYKGEWYTLMQKQSDRGNVRMMRIHDTTIRAKPPQAHSPDVLSMYTRAQMSYTDRDTCQRAQAQVKYEDHISL